MAGTARSEAAEPETVSGILDRIAEAAERDPVSVGDVLEALGRRSFGPVLLVAGLVILVPLLGDIPGVPTLMAVVVLLCAGQLLAGRRSFWLPRALLARTVSREAAQGSLARLRRPARWLDRLARPRLAPVTSGGGVYAIAALCIAIALATPVMELVPFSANGAGLALTAFGLALIGRDGALALAAMVVTAVTGGAILWVLL